MDNNTNFKHIMPLTLPNTIAGEALCEKCKLKDVEGGRVDGVGNGKNSFMLLGEVPGGSDSGGLSTYLASLTKLIGVDLDECHVTNVCLCNPGKDKKGKPKKAPIDAIRRCAPRLKAEFDKYKPKAVIILGDVALKALFPYQSVTRLHGKRWRIDNTAYIAMYPPIFAFQNPYYATTIKYDWKHLLAQPLLSEINGDYDNDDFGKPLSLAIDVETTGLERDATIIGGSLSPEPGKAYYYPGHDNIIKAIQRFKPWTLIGHNLKFDLQKLAAGGLDINAYNYEDTMLKAYSIGYDDLRLKSLETQELNLWHPTTVEVMGASKTLVDKPVATVKRYCNQDADSTSRLDAHFNEVMDDREKGIYNDIEKPLLPALIHMELAGVKVDLDYVRKWDKQLARKYNATAKQLNDKYDLSSELLNSPKQLGDWLNKQGIRLPKTASGQTATGKELLAAYIDKHPAISLILQRRQYNKLRTTYVKAYLNLTDEKGYLHASYNQTNVITGRTSCSNPNLQNLPHTKDARRPFIASPGNKLLGVDYSQIDMRVLAHLSQDKALLAAFERGEDVHNMMADMLFGDHSPNHRYLVKSASYMMLFLGTARGLFIYMNAPMGEFNIKKMGKPPSEGECEEHLKRYYDTFPGIPEYHQKAIAFANEHGYIDDYYGRRRYFPKLASSNRGERRKAEREVVNMPIAGTAATIFKKGIFLTDRIWTPIMNIHDELIFDIPGDKIPELQPKLEAAMLSVDFPVPLMVKSQVADNMGGMV